MLSAEAVAFLADESPRVRKHRRGHGSEGHDAYVAQRRAQKLSYAERLAAAEAFLADKPALPAARVPDFEAPRRRR